MKDLNNKLHLIAFDIPYPANYGGVIDIFYKIKSLHKHGTQVILHAYQYGREQSEVLNKYCHQVFYYKRKTFRNPFYSNLPYIVASRNSSELLENLLAIDAPILFDGLHCCYYLSHPELKNRFKMVRTHNIEHDYYSSLEEVESNFFKKYFFRVESERLKNFEPNLKNADIIFPISPADTEYFKKNYPENKVEYLPAFHPNEELSCKEGKGQYILYHGNLSVGENDEAARFLVKEVFSKVNLPFIIAGSNPSKYLIREISGYSHIELKDQCSSEEILDLIQNAQINILPTFQATGIKLKLINSLYRGRFCLVNDTMVNQTGLESLCSIANTPAQFQKQVKKLWDSYFDLKELEKRKNYLEQNFNNLRNAEKIADILLKKQKASS